MMASGLAPAAAALAAGASAAAPAASIAAAPIPVAAATQGSPTPVSDTGGERKAKQRDLYSPSPTHVESGVAGGFYKAYGRSITPLELTQGARLGALVGRPPAPSVTEARAGIGAGGVRPRSVLLAALIVLAAELLAAFVAPSAARAAVPDQFLGVSTEDAFTGKDAYAQRQLRAQRSAGFTVARQVFRWNEIEWANGQYDFSATDRFVRNAAIAGMRVMPLLQGEPAWASSRPRGNKTRNLYPPKDNATYAAFAGTIAQRYGPTGTFWASNPELTPKPILTYQLWNEPNFPIYWGGKPNSAAYARLAIAGAAAIRAVDPNAYIVSAGLPDSKIGQKPVPFVRGMLKAGGGAAINAIGIHPYAKTPAKTLQIARQLRRAINGAGGRKLDLWVTEIGWAAGGPRTPERTVTAAQQGPTIVAAVKKLAAARKSLRLKGIAYFAWRDSAIYKGGKDFWGLHTGLLDRKGKAKPSLKVVSKALRKLK